MSYNSEFVENPITFLRKYALSPPDGNPGDVIKSWKIPNAGNIDSGANDNDDPRSSTVRLKEPGLSKVFSTFTKHPGFPECLTVSLAPTRTSPEDFAQFWLPWESLSITRYKLPPVPDKNLGGGKNLKEFPNFFMTAGISGCSIFVEGPPTEPTVYHAGITGNLHRPAEDFWKEQIAEAFRGTAKEGHEPTGQVHSNHYMKADADVIQRYTAWYEAQNQQGFAIEVQSCFGSVVGVRFDKDWAFYLQENVMIQDIQILKRSQVSSAMAVTGNKRYTVKGTNDVVDRTVTVKPRSFGPDKVKKVYARRINSRCNCVRVTEIYPTRSFVGELKDFAMRAT